ncbi:thioredoxin family protein [Sulfitobacter sp. SK012]|uniref:thioredoxin family protein n=1 Tax=Sulfitobacter sp. SK012 TaxID=1389005 RepID=UPI000E0B7BC9|nr:thioredoxin family protein [Sulfitobacter sp. SK012]AXI47984.1 thioredoxin family protein [Sulfitobacter sp. SK012]
MLLDTPVCDFGWKAPAFDLATPQGARHDLVGLMGENGLLIAFICNHCPYVQAIADKLSSDAASLMAEGVGVVAVMSNDYAHVPSDNPENMVKFSDRHGFPFPYLIDEDQSVAKAYGAVCTPDFFGFNANFELQYRGRLDNAGRETSDTRKAELLDAMRQIAATKHGPADQTASIGCSIKWRDT